MLKTTLSRTIALFAFFAIGFMTITAHAQPLPSAMPQGDRIDIARAEAYLNSLTTLRSPFIQTTPDGNILRGMIYISRPGKMRIEYDPPNESFVVADGLFLYYWDAELEQQTNAPLGTTMADLILRKDLRLNGDIKVIHVGRGEKTLEITVVYAKDPAQGQMTLFFDELPMRLRKWRVVDAQRQVTEVALLNPETDLKLPSRLFKFLNPKFTKQRSN